MPDEVPVPVVQGIKPPAAPVLDTNVADNWRLFRQKWKNYSVISKLDQQEQSYQVALLLHTVGDEALRIYNGFVFTTTENNRTIKEILEKFDEYAVGEINETYERFVFNKRCQREDESFESFLTELRTLVKSCNFCDTCLESIVRDRIVLGIRNPDIQNNLLRKRKLSLQKAIDICKASENASAHGRALRPDSVNKVSQSTTSKKHNQPQSSLCQKSRKPFSKVVALDCKFCDTKHPMKKEECPAWGKVCKLCKQKNHFAAKCYGKNSKQKNSKKVYQVQSTNESNASAPSSDSDQSEEWVYLVGLDSVEEAGWVYTVDNSSDTGKSRDIRCRMLIDNSEVVFLVDTGATVNIISSRYIRDFEPTKRSLKMWNSSRLTPLGTCRKSIRNPKNGKRYNVEFVVIEEDFLPIIGFSAAQQMHLIEVVHKNLERVAAIRDKNTTTSVGCQFSEVFDNELGSLPGMHSLKVDPSVHPVVMPSRRIPIALRPKLKAELNRLVTLGVITPVEEPTPWVSQLVITQKPSGKLRVCIDPRELNKALLREHFILPTLDETLHELGNSRVFSKADLSSGYWHVKLDSESSILTTFQTTFGRYRWLRLPFGINVSSEIFQRKLLDALDGLPGIVCIADDVIIHGRTTEEHDLNLDKFLQRCKEKNIKLNKEKFELRLSQISFMGHSITREGLKHDPDKSKAITHMSAPKNIRELRRFLGLLNYLAKFLPHLSDVVHPLQQLTKKDTPWNWSSSQEEAFTKAKELVSRSPTLTYYDPNKVLVLENDASEYGLGSTILQEGKPIAFASRTLNDPESRYAQIEKEMLAAVYGLEKFHYYTFGRPVTVVTDHKPLVAIAKKPLSKAPKRLQALLLRAQAYNYSLIYKPGKQIPVADALSRAPLPEKPNTEVVSVNNITFSPIRPERLDQIRAATQNDVTLTVLKSTLMEGWPSDKALLPQNLHVYYNYRDELTVQDGIILRGDRVVIPLSMRTEMKQKVHSGHLGINSSLRRARDLIFWPGMSSEIRQYIETCAVCASMCDKQTPETLFMHDVPHRPWEKVGSDLFTIENRNYLVTVDYYSNFFEVDFLPETTSKAVINKLKHHFARHGIPDILISDNGPQYNSENFKHFSKRWGFKHDPISPGNSKANGAAEAAVKVAKRLMKKSIKAGDDPFLALLSLRNTPTEGLDISPAQRLLGRRTKTELPTTANKLNPSIQNADYQRVGIENKRAKSSEYYNTISKDLKPLNTGDNVRVQPIQSGKEKWEQATVKRKIKSRSYEVETDNGRTLRRNRQFLRSTKRSREVPIDPLELSYSDLENANNSTENLSYMHTPIQNSSDSVPEVAHSAESPGSNTAIPYCTRAGRITKRVEKLNL